MLCAPSDASGAQTECCAISAPPRQSDADIDLSLQVCLEIAVVTNLLVNLQAVALAVGDDDAVGFRVKLDRRREAEAPLRFKASYPAPRLRHIGVGVNGLLAPFRQHLRVADQIGNWLALRVEDANPMVAPIGDVDVAIAVHRDIGRVIEQCPASDSPWSPRQPRRTVPDMVTA